MKLGRTTKSETTPTVSFEKVASDLLMISIDNKSTNQASLLSYWRLLGKGDNPPLEVGINTVEKTIKSITFFIDPSNFKSNAKLEIATEKGNPIVDIYIFSKENEYVDEKGLYFVSIQNNIFSCVFDSGPSAKLIVKNGRVGFLINEIDELCGVQICDLSQNEIMTISSLSK